MIEFLPHVSMRYYQFHQYSWAGLAILIAWGTWLASSKTRSALAVALYIAVAINLITLWFLVTLFVLYLNNQTLLA